MWNWGRSRGPARTAVCHAVTPGGHGIFRAQVVGLARWGRRAGRGFPGSAPFPGEALETWARPDDAPPQCLSSVGCLAVGLSGQDCLVPRDWLGRPGLWRGWRRRVPRPAQPRCRLRGRSLGTRLREIPSRSGGRTSRNRSGRNRTQLAAPGTHRAGKGAGSPACSPETTGAGSPWPGAPPWRWSSNAAASDSASSATRPR